MFSSLLPAPPLKPKLHSFRLKPVSSILLPQCGNRNHSSNVPSFSLSKSRVFASIANLVVVEELEEGPNGRFGVGGVLIPAQEQFLPKGLRREVIPNHVAMIMDGNVRWARQKGLPPSSGHEAGVLALRGVVELCCKWGIRVLTVFAFSYDNWVRPQVEVDFLMSMFERGMEEVMETFMREDIRINVIGDSSKLPMPLQKLITDAVETTKNNSRLQLIVAASYSGRYDIVQACKSIAEKVKDGLILPEEIDEPLITQQLETNCTDFPYPDLLIRTSGELRVSNFMLWQLAYTELFFAQSFWPDFGEEEFIEALQSFQKRHRRYGGRHP